MLTQLIDPQLIPRLTQPLPHDLKAERQLLGELIQVPGKYSTVDPAITEEIFFDLRHRKLFGLIVTEHFKSSH